MEKIVTVLLTIVAATAAYFWGVQEGQAKMQEMEYQQQAVRRAEQLTQHIQYVTLLNLEKDNELEVLLRSRIMAERTRLELDLNRPELAGNLLIENVINMAREVMNQPAAEAMQDNTGEAN